MRRQFAEHGHSRARRAGARRAGGCSRWWRPTRFEWVEGCEVYLVLDLVLARVLLQLSSPQPTGPPWCDASSGRGSGRGWEGSLRFSGRRAKGRRREGCAGREEGRERRCRSRPQARSTVGRGLGARRGACEKGGKARWWCRVQGLHQGAKHLWQSIVASSHGRGGNG